MYSFFKSGIRTYCLVVELTTLYVRGFQFKPSCDEHGVIITNLDPVIIED